MVVWREGERGKSEDVEFEIVHAETKEGMY
jgi:hypothetical protein